MDEVDKDIKIYLINMKDSFITNGLIIGSIIGGIGEIDRLIREWHTSRYF